MKTIYNKLVRDNIPTIIEEDGKTCVTRILNEEEYIHCLKEKLLEEVKEVQDASEESIVEELADVMELVHAISDYYGIDMARIYTKQLVKGKTNGRFEKRIFLESVE